MFLPKIFTFLAATLPNMNEKFDYRATGPINPDQPVTDLFSNASGWLLTLVVSIAVIFLIIGGIQYASALGDSDKIDTAKRTMLYSIIGLVLALLAFVIVPIVVRLFQ